MNCVILITTPNVAELHRMARRFHEPAQALGLDFVISGPWPAYSSDLLKTLQNGASNVISA